LAALVFAIHPVNVATVAWISEQKNTLSMLFYAVAILLYLKFDENDKWSWYALSLVAFLLAALAKSAVVMLPVVLLGCVWWQRGRVGWKDLVYSVPFFVVSLALALVTIWFQHYRALEQSTVRTAGFLLRLATAGWVPWFYLGKALLPVDLAMMYPQWDVDASRWISYLPGMILIACLALFWWKRETWGRPLFFGLGYFVVTLFPVLGFFDQGFYRYSLVADHWQYYSIIGVIALVVGTGEATVRRLGGPGRPVGVLASVVVLVALGMAAWRRDYVYATEETLWRDTLAKSPRCWVAHNNLGAFLAQTGPIEEAIAHLQQALQIKPDYPEPHYNWALALERAGKAQEAIRQYEQALQMKPDYTKAHYNLGLALWGMGRVDDAIAHYEQALRIEPDCVEAHNNLAVALWQTGKIEEAIRHYELAVQIQPDFAEAQNSLGLALRQVGRTRQAIEHWEQALKTKPDFADACNNLAWPLATLPPTEGGNPTRAVALAERACELTEMTDPAYLDTLAAAYAASGRFNDAATVAQKAVELARSGGEPQLAANIEDRLQLYRAGRAYRESGSFTNSPKP
jgi:Tfp pilus assembly protein PilF